MAEPSLQQKTLAFLGASDYNSVIKLHKGLAYRIAGKFAKTAEAKKIDFDDLLQSALIEMYTSCKSYRAERGMSFSSYAYRNMQRTLSKKVRARGPDSEVSLEEMVVEPSENLMEETVMFKERVSDAMAIVFNAISNNTQWVAFLAFLEGVSLHSVAKEMGCSPQNLDITLKRLFERSRVHG